MCGVCGCSDHHDHQPLNQHHHDHPERIQVEQDLLAENQRHAKKNQDAFQKQQITAINLMSSPGSGKTTLLGRSVQDLKQDIEMAVVVGDQQTQYDADALKANGANAIQINTGKVCHLDAHMLGHALENLQLKEKSLLFIENIGNLVCPALFQLGEKRRVVILSVTEGDNKPLKYPEMFHQADLMILTKIDLLPYVDFDVEQCIRFARQINPKLQVIQLSAKTGEGLSEWYQWLRDQREDATLPPAH